MSFCGIVSGLLSLAVVSFHICKTNGAGLRATFTEQEGPNPFQASPQSSGTQLYYCLEDYKPIGNVIKNLNWSNDSSKQQQQQPTSGQVARHCSRACDAEAACSAFHAAGPGVGAAPGAHCQLLANSTAALREALVRLPGLAWPAVVFTSPVSHEILPPSFAWLCFKGSGHWDDFGAATYALLHTGVADPTTWPTAGGSSSSSGVHLVPMWRGPTFSSTAAASAPPLQCEALCAATDSCSFWTYVAAQQHSGQAPYNCFTRKDAFRGQNGWTGTPKSDIWIPDSEMECFLNKEDWRQLGLMLSPAVETIHFNATYLTVYPERVSWAAAAASCSSLPAGRLAVLDSSEAMQAAASSLLTTLAAQTSLRSAWVGARGSNTLFNPKVNPSQPQQDLPNSNMSQPEQTLQWLTGEQVAPTALSRLVGLSSIWFVPANSTSVCARLLVQTLSPPSQAGPDSSSLAGAPGIWYFDCNKPAGFICESSSPSPEPMTGRSSLLDPSHDLTPWGENVNFPVWKLAVATLLPTLGILLLAWQVSHWRESRKARRLPDLLWQQKKRLMGVPLHGPMSLVVTDIQDYTRLSSQAPEDMAQSLLLHHQLVKAAAYEHVGSVLEQEGDSFTLVFHEPQDAVGFCLQVQQALLQQHWPPGIHYKDTWQAAVAQHTTTPACLAHHEADRSADASAAKITSPQQPRQAPYSSRQAVDHQPLSSCKSSSAGSVVSATAPHSLWLQGQVMGPANMQQQQQQHNRVQEPGLLSGLHVRMGVASGVVPYNQSVKHSAVYQAAQDVSTASNGGQILMDEPTFTAVKESMRRLGLVTASGIDYRRLYAVPRADSSGSSKPGLINGLVSAAAEVLVTCCVCQRRQISRDEHLAAPSEHAVVLDMGCYEVLSTTPTPRPTPAHIAPTNVAAVAAAVPGEAIKSTVELWGSEEGIRLVQQYQRCLQQQLLHQHGQRHSGLLGSWSADEDDHEELGQHPYMLTSYLRSMSAGVNSPEQHSTAFDQHLQQHHHQQPASYHRTHQQQKRHSYHSRQEQQQRHLYHSRQEQQQPAWWGDDGGHQNIPHHSPSWVRLILSKLLGVDVLSSRHSAQRSKPGQAAGTPLPEHKANHAGQQRQHRQHHHHYHRGSGSSSFSDEAVNSSRNHKLLFPPSIRLYQILAPGLVTRAALFGSKLALHSNWRCLDAPYFAAPGLSSSSSSSSAAPMPVAAAAGLSSGQPPWSPTSMQRRLSVENATAAAAAPHRIPPAGPQPGHLLQASYSPGSNSSAMPVGSFVSSTTPSSRAAAPAPHQVTGSAASHPRGSHVLLQPMYPPVSIVFAAVEGAQQLAQHPELARCVHGLVMQLMLQLLRHEFPGGYLVRAYPGELRYMAALPTSCQAAAWCLTVQEAALYLPYPAALLGLSSFGVQLNAAGRLVLRGPRFKMGFSEGSPTCILPDHMGRADYNGPLVNRAARYADAAAHGGQVVTDMELAGRVLQQLQMGHSTANKGLQRGRVHKSTSNLPAEVDREALQHSCTSSSVNRHSSDAGCKVSGLDSARSLPRNFGSSIIARLAAAHSTFSKAAAVPASSAVAVASTRPTVAAGHVSLTAQASQQEPLVVPADLSQVTTASGAAAAVANTSQDHNPALNASRLQPPQWCDAAAESSSTTAAPSDSVAAVFVSVEFSWLGSFLFKGSAAPVEMVSLSPVVLQGRLLPDKEPSGKGVRVLQRTGVMGKVDVKLPAGVDRFWDKLT